MRNIHSFDCLKVFQAKDFHEVLCWSEEVASTFEKSLMSSKDIESYSSIEAMSIIKIRQHQFNKNVVESQANKRLKKEVLSLRLRK